MAGAVITFTGSRPDDDNGSFIATWTGGTFVANPNETTGQPFHASSVLFGAADRSVQVTGTFGAAGSLTIQGTNDLAQGAWATLNDPMGDPLTFTAAGLSQVLECSLFIRWIITAGDGTTSLAVRLLCVRHYH
jgi:hypothetical protein